MKDGGGRGERAPSRLQTHLARFFSSSASLSECILKARVLGQIKRRAHTLTGAFYTHGNRSCYSGVCFVYLCRFRERQREKNQFRGTFAGSLRAPLEFLPEAPLMYSENAFFRVATFIFFTAARRVQIRSKKNLIKGNDTPPT